MQSNTSRILLLLLLFCALSVRSQNTNSTRKDSVKVVQKTDTLNLAKKDTLKPKESILDLITHTAVGYTKQNAKNKTVTFYDKAQVTYTDIDLKAGIIIVDYLKNTMFAKGIKDSTGYVQRPVFKQADQESEQDSMIYNFKTKRAIIYGIKTKQEPGMFVLGNKAKRVNDSTIYMRKIRFTTSDKKIPDYYIGVNKGKVVPGKKIVAGLSNLVIADVPTPVFLPFAYFPIGQSRNSGFIIPTFNTNAGSSRGIGIQNGGYYFAVNDYVDLEILGDAFSNGSWGLRTRSLYVQRYRFSGNFNLSFEKIIQSTRGFDDFSEATNFNLQWTHRKDPKSSPNSNFTASVNLGSSQYFRQSINELNQSSFLSNTFNSSISYQKTFVGTPFNMSVNATHSQNTNTNIITMTLPSLQLNMNRIYPFAGKGGVKRNPIQNIGLNYNMQGVYQINTTEDQFFKSEMFKTARSGVVHTADANTNVTVLRHFTLSPNVQYREVWNFDYVNKTYDNAANAVVTDTIRGFRSFREYSTSLSLSTNIYGDFTFKKGRLKAIRHTVRPSVSFSYRPDFAARHNLQVRQSADPNDLLTYSPFEQGVYGRPTSGTSGSIGISINNVLEAKVAPKDPDSDEEYEKIMLLNNLNISTSYNIAADSLRWSNITLATGVRLFKDKLAINFNGSFDPYQVNASGVRIDEFNSFPRLALANVTANYTISSSDFSKDKKDDKKSNSGNGNQDTPDVLGAGIDPSNRFATNPNSPQNNQPEEKEATLYRSSLPWRLNMAYTALYTNNGISNIGISTHTLTFGGDIELTPKWKVGFSSGYDVINGGFSYTRLNFSRDLDSWRFNFNWVPFGLNQSYTFFIGVKSSILSDLKYDQNRPPNRVLF